MSPQIIDCEQGSPDWFAARIGIPTASEFDTVMTKGRGGGESKTRRTYMLKLLGELLTGKPMDSVTTRDMERGKTMESEARDLYVLLTDSTPQQVGFVRNGDVGASPDSLIDLNGLLEIKTKAPHLQLDLLLADALPDEHKAQVQGQLWICEREWCDFVSYWPGLKPFVKRIYRDEPYIAALKVVVADFNADLQRLRQQLQ